jgi:hypothetical protein
MGERVTKKVGSPSDTPEPTIQARRPKQPVGHREIEVVAQVLPDIRAVVYDIDAET